MSQLEENKQSKPRVFKTAMNVEFVLSGGALAVFKELLKTYEDAINEDELPMELGSDYLLIRLKFLVNLKNVLWFIVRRFKFPSKE